MLARTSAEVLKQARAIGLRGRDLQARIGCLARYAEPHQHRIANRRFGSNKRGIY